MNLKFVICGIEHSGTTLVSDLFRQAPGIDAGFEVGVLLADRPAEFREMQPFSKNMKAGWGITETDMDYICSAVDFPEFYRRLGQASTAIERHSELFDKTPRYLAQLDLCLQKVPVQFIATFKDPRSIVFSDFNRSGTDDFDTWYSGYRSKKIGYMQTLYEKYLTHRDNPRVAFVSLEALTVNTEATVRRLFDHVGIPFQIHYLLLKNLRYRNTKSNFIDMRIPFAYLESFDETRCKRIVKDFSEFEYWFYG